MLDPPIALTALVAGDAQLGIAVLAAMRERKLRPGQELSVVVCDDIELFRLVDPPMSVVFRDAEEMGAAAARMLMARLSDGSAARARHVLPTTFIPPRLDRFSTEKSEARRGKQLFSFTGQAGGPERTEGPMMEFLVEIEVRLPPDTSPDRKAKLVAAEVARAKELSVTGTIYRLWRVPGRWANVGIWCAEDATELHDAISSLPLYPWLEVDVTPLANHPSDPGGPVKPRT